MGVLVGHSYSFSVPLLIKLKITNLFIDGVAIFFTLSGFLVGTLFLKKFKETINIKEAFDFVKRRWWRILPSYYATLALLCIVYLLSSTPKFGSILPQLFFVQNILHCSEYLFFRESWSLAVEFWFYLLLPFLGLIFCLVFNKFDAKKYLIYFVIFIILSSTIFRFLMLFLNPPFDSTSLFNYFRLPVVARLDSFAFGLLAAWFLIFYPAFFYKNKNKLFVIGIIVLYAYKPIIISTVGDNENLFKVLSQVSYPTIALFSALLLPFLYSLKTNKIGVLGVIITKISILSYLLYLVNVSIIFDKIVPSCVVRIKYFYPNINVPLTSFILFWILSFALSILLYKTIEKPITKWRLQKYASKLTY
jgi:peptidoglycan/LPS O-acetylase OafA/YrhL